MRLKWDQTGEKTYETGVSNGVLYPQKGNGLYSKGVAWNGLSSVSESPSGAEPQKIYADNIAYLTLISTEEFGATIEAYTYPDEFAECDGSAEVTDGVTIGQQDRKPFGMAYKTILGNDTEKDAHGYKLHLIYGATAAPTEKSYSSVNDSPEAITFSWELSTTPEDVTGKKPTASVSIDSTKVKPDNLKKLEDILFGSEKTEPRLPLPDEVISIMSSGVISLTAKAIDGKTAKYGKKVSDLQTDITIDDDSISGTLKYVTGFTGYDSTNTTNQSGYYLALDVNVPDGATVLTKIEGGDNKKYVDLTSDKFCVYRIKDKAQKIIFKVTKDDDSIEKTYDLTGLTLQPNGQGN